MLERAIVEIRNTIGRISGRSATEQNGHEEAPDHPVLTDDGTDSRASSVQDEEVEPIIGDEEDQDVAEAITETGEQVVETAAEVVEETPDHPVFGDEPTGQDPDGTVDVASDEEETTTPDHPVMESENGDAPDHPVFEA